MKKTNIRRIEDEKLPITILCNTQILGDKESHENTYKKAYALCDNCYYEIIGKFF